jgi:Cys-tRNA(Pro) deacylase
MSHLPPVSVALTSLNIPHRVFRHPGPVHSLEQAAAERGQQPEQVVRSILFRLGEGNYRMVLVAGPAQISWPTLRRHLGVSRVTMATPDEVLAVTGYPIGAVSPFGIAQPLPILVDENVFAPDEVSIGSGERGVTVILAAESLRQALGDVEIGRFCE